MMRIRYFLVVLPVALLIALAGCSSGAVPASAEIPPLSATLPSPLPPIPSAVPLSPTRPLPTAIPLPSPTLSPTSTPLPPSTTPVPATSTPEALTYAFPVRGARVEYGAYHHDYPATDIFCPIGSAFLAPTSGVVDYVSRIDIWDPATNLPQDRSGLAVAIIGDDGLRYYGSHLSEVAEGIEPGVRVIAGQLLGLTGKSGNARSTPPHLHFGISHPTTPDDWAVRRGEIPPFEYLKAWQRGESRSPAQ